MPATSSFVENDLEFVIPGCSFSHLLTIVTADRLSIAIHALQAIQAIGGSLETMRLSRRGEQQLHELRVTGLRPHEARALSDRLAELPGVHRAKVEHHLARRSEPVPL